MSKDDSANLRLLGSPVNLSYRGKRNNYDSKRNICNRPRSALQNSCFTPDIQEISKRPFSAGSKEHLPSTRTFLNTFSAELIQSYNNTPNTIRVVLPPTAELLADRNSTQHKNESRDCNTSDHGSEDTYISLGTKIKARAQSPKGKSSNCKNFIKYRNIAKKGRKAMDNAEKAHGSNVCNFDVKITEKKDPSPTRTKNLFDESIPSQRLKAVAYDYYFNSLDKERLVDNEKKQNDNPLSGRVSFGSGALHSEVEQALDTYSRRLGLTGQQLSLVEEESTQDLESAPSRNSLSPEPALVEVSKPKEENQGDSSGTYVINQNDKPVASNQNQTQGPRTYDSFYDDFQTSIPAYNKMSSTIAATDSSSKDSGYTDSGGPDERPYKRGYTCPNKMSLFMPTNTTPSRSLPKSLECIPRSTNQDDETMKTFPPMKKPLNWAAPCHSRLLYKDFFLKKETPPSPKNLATKTSATNIPGATSEDAETEDNKVDYPQYLLNSNTKAYTTKVIEDYKKEIEAINNLHELTLRDIKTDAISPTPYNIDKLFDQHSVVLNNSRPEVGESSQDSRRPSPFEYEPTVKETNLRSNKKDISNVSTKELIQNYFKVKESDYKGHAKDLKKYNKKINNLITTVENGGDFKQVLNNKGVPKISTSKSSDPIQIKNQTQKSAFTLKAPLSSRIESIQNDRDIESWMSLSAPSPRVIEIEDISENLSVEMQQTIPRDQGETRYINNAPQEIRNSTKTSRETSRSGSSKALNEDQNQQPAMSSTSVPETPKPKELSADATVLDIYSMLKEIENLGETPAPTVPVEASNETTGTQNKEEDHTPKDNFMEIFQFLEKVEQSANDALSVVTNTTLQTIPSLEVLLKLPQTELAQRLVTASLQLEERSCCIALLQESLTTHKEQMVNKVSNLEKQSTRNIGRVKSECEEAIKRHQNFIDQLINDKKTLNHRIEQLVDERRALEERWRRAARSLEERYQLELRNQHDKMAAAQQVARQRWVRQKAEKIKELTVKGLEGELREMAERQQKEIADLKMAHAEHLGRSASRHAAEMEELRASCDEERERALLKERQNASARLEKQILELESTYQEQRKRLVAEMRAENERVASGLSEKEKTQRQEIEKWKEEQEKLLQEKMAQVNKDIAKARAELEEEAEQKRQKLQAEFDQYKRDFEAEQHQILKKRETEIAQQNRLERDREIEKAIESMEAEAQAGRRDLQEALRRNKEKFEAELKELAETERATLRRYQEAQARVRQTEDRCAELEVEINQLQTRNKVLTDKTSQLEQRAEETRASCEAAWSAKVELMRKELEDARRTHEEQMHQLYAKVKIAVARKDSAIQAMTRETAKCQEKITLLEQKLQLQRKDYLKQK